MTVTTDNTPVYSGVRFSASKKREQTMNNEMMALICGLLMGVLQALRN